ncbi:MAG TPA: hypothetical protein VMU41_12420 [Candidatus Binataceae bacterium]|nr:hypothetical protein [Candidatus Binataceae bacterium]
MDQSLKVIQSLALGVVLVCATIGAASAFCLQPDPPRVCSELFTADSVFVGTVVSSKYIPNETPDGYDGWTYRLKVAKVYRGPRKKIISVFTENASAKMPLTVGDKYLLFAAYHASYGLEIYGCGNSGEFPHARATAIEVERVLRNAKFASTGNIGGLVQTYGAGGDPLPAVKMIAQSDVHQYSGITGKDGWFHIQVPPGRYRVTAEPSKAIDEDWLVSPGDLSFERPNDLEIKAGQCADLEFTASQRVPNPRIP